MHSVLNRELFLIKEHVGAFQSANHYDVFDPETGETILQCREPRLGFFTKLLRFTDYKQVTPFNVEVSTPSGELVVGVKRGAALFFSKVTVYNDREETIGTFAQKVFSIGGAFRVLDAEGQPLCDLKGKWTSWEFSFRAGDAELATVTKKWAGLGKELFTSADNYVLRIDPSVPADSTIRQLIVAAVMCIDMVLKE